MNSRQARVEVAAKRTVGDLVLEVSVRRADHAHVDRLRDGRADRQDLALLQNPEELRLRLRRHVADLVQEQGAFVRRLQQAGLVLRGAGERALPVPEQLAFDQILRKRGAVDGLEGARHAPRPDGRCARGAPFPSRSPPVTITESCVVATFATLSRSTSI